MKTIKIFGVLIASAALTACGGGDGGDSADTADAGSDAMETAAAAEENTMAEAAEPEAPAEEPMAEEPAAEEPMAEEPAAPAEEEPAAAGGDDGAFMVAGLTGDAAAGRRIFARCQTCHVLAEGQNRVGPSLYGIFGREAGSVDGFRYSDANANSGITWTPEVMFEYLENPREYIPGTTMAFPGLRSEQDRADVLAYIAANGGNG
ncbi:cytochrome c family protein [Maricaulaceae bacterium NA33B04]|nr:cytochrome c family protein [Maricaulaceae bacterium NA33B04]